MNNETEAHFFGTEKISKIIIRLAPPVMLAQLIQALYNIVDSYYVGLFSGDGLAALSAIYPIQYISIALAVGTGVGLNTLLAACYAKGRLQTARKAAGTGVALAIGLWALFSILIALFLEYFVNLSLSSPIAREHALTYGYIVCIGSLPLFLESIFTKIHQAHGNMRKPMLAQVVGAMLNIILDPILIFGWGPIPALGITGAALATVTGQIAAAAITFAQAFSLPPAFKEQLRYAKVILHLGFPNILMQLLFVLYILVLNIILAGFCDEAVTVLGLYYKLQTFFFIPFMAMETCIIPVLSYNHACKAFARCQEILKTSILFICAFMSIGILAFELIPEYLIGFFSDSPKVLEIGVPAFRVIATSFIPQVFALMYPNFFQAIGATRPSTILAITRQIFCLIPIFWLLSHLGLYYTWFAFPLSEVITGLVGYYLYKQWIIATVK